MERPPSPIAVDGEEEFEVEAILRHKGTGARRLYQVLWKGYPITKTSREPESHLAMLLRSSRTTCTTSRLQQDVCNNGIVATVGLIDGVPEDLPGRHSFSGWKQLVMGSHVWREITFGVPSPRPLPEGCSYTEDCHIKVWPIGWCKNGQSNGIRFVFVFPTMFLGLWTAAPLWGEVLLCFVSLRVDLPTVWHGLGR